MQTLAAMLRPCGLDEFLTNYWTEKAIFISSEDREKFSNLFDCKKLNHLLKYHDGDDSLINLVINGRNYSNITYKKSELIESIRNGATLRVNRVDKRIPEVADFVSKITHEVGYKTHINVYCSLPGKQGFDCHYDPYEIFILQIDGRKEWHVFQETIIKYPLKYSIALPPNGLPYLSCILNPGDVLYIPRGHLHYAVAVDQPSLHLTMGIRCSTGIDFLEWLVDKLRQKEELRKSLPIPTRENASVTMGVHLESLSQKLDEYITDRDIESEYIDYLRSLQQPITEFDLPHQLGVNLFPKGINTWFTRPSWQRVKISIINENEYTVKVGSKELTLKQVTKPFLDKLFCEETFTGSDVASWLPELDWDTDIVPLLSSLVMEGIIFVDSDNA